MNEQETKVKNKLTPTSILLIVSGVLILLCIPSAFLPLLSLSTGFNESVTLPSTMLMFGGKLDVTLGSGTYYFSFSPNIFFFIILQLILLSALAVFTSINSKRNAFISVIFLVVSIVFVVLIPVWISIINPAYSSGEFKARIGFIVLVILSSLALASDVFALVVKKVYDSKQ